MTPEAVLASSDVIASLMPTPDRVRRVRGDKKKVGPRCANHKCGVCVGCLDDQRWEAIYQDRFADPEYYTLRFRWTSAFPQRCQF